MPDQSRKDVIRDHFALYDQGITIDRVVDGRIVDRRGSFDLAGLMQQLGAVPEAR